MRIFTDTSSLRQHLQPLRHGARRIGLVPTMGNLHEGHLYLVDCARQQSGHVVATIFVNPMQFGPNEDLERYPRTPGQDQEQLQAHGCDALFMPPVAEMYPRGLEQQTRVVVPELAGLHCGAARPGHFDGVATIVSKLFNLVQPDLAFFGLKDYQQLLIIRQMAADLCFPLDIIGVPTQREPSGLALSSRNQYLSAEERQQAPRLYQSLQQLRTAIVGGERDYRNMELSAQKTLASTLVKPEYIAICNAATLQPAKEQDKALVILAAIRLGSTRLIDNITLTLP